MDQTFWPVVTSYVCVTVPTVKPQANGETGIALGDKKKKSKQTNRQHMFSVALVKLSMAKNMADPHCCNSGLYQALIFPAPDQLFQLGSQLVKQYFFIQPTVHDGCFSGLQPGNEARLLHLSFLSPFCFSLPAIVSAFSSSVCFIKSSNKSCI